MKITYIAGNRPHKAGGSVCSERLFAPKLHEAVTERCNFTNLEVFFNG